MDNLHQPLQYKELHCYPLMWHQRKKYKCTIVKAMLNLSHGYLAYRRKMLEPQECQWKYSQPKMYFLNGKCNRKLNSEVQFFQEKLH